MYFYKFDMRGLVEQSKTFHNELTLEKYHHVKLKVFRWHAVRFLASPIPISDINSCKFLNHGSSLYFSFAFCGSIRVYSEQSTVYGFAFEAKRLL